MSKHEQVCVEHPDGWVADIDIKIAPLIKALWEMGIDTFNSCQDNQPGVIWIEFSTAKDLTRFLTMVISKIPVDDLYCRIFDSWQYSVLLDDSREYYDSEVRDIRFDETGECEISMSISLRFPISDYELVYSAFKEALHDEYAIGFFRIYGLA